MAQNHIHPAQERLERELRIEGALEQVRSRTMAMQHSDELKGAATLLFQQVKALGAPAYSCGYNIWEKDANEFTSWMSTQDGNDINPVLKIPMTEDANFIRFKESRLGGEEFYVIEMRGERMQEHYRYLKTIPAFREYFEYAEKTGFAQPETQIHHLANFSHGNLLFITLEPCPEFHDVFKRFAAVFDQTYTRFLDLHKAEAQAWESQIQLALERVRARTMAMQRSEELMDTAFLLFHQLKELGIHQWANSFQLWDDDMTSVNTQTCTQGLEVQKFKLPTTEDPVMINIVGAARRGEALYVEPMGGEPLQNHYKYMFSIPACREIFFGQLADAGFTPPTFQIFHAAYFSYGYILFITHEPYPEAHDIFIRFAKVFEQTYTRFLDLQKAESQTRESQIELGLERVRARAMAMQKSVELAQLVDTVFKELTKLDFALTWCIINIIDESSRSNTVWAANPDLDKAPESYYMKFEDYPFHHAMMKGYGERRTKYVYVLKGQEKKVYDEYLFNETEFRRVPTAAQAVSRAMEKYVVSFSFSNFGGLQTVGDAPLSDENLDILHRFGKVFDLTYTRFNDLEKAEAQARESQIQLALERVRARTMAMQKSEELKDIIQVVYDQFVHLNVNIEHTGFIIDYKEKDEMNIWLADRHEVPTRVTIPYFDCSHWNSFIEAKEKGTDFFTNHLDFEEKNKFYKDLFELIPGLKEETKEYYFSRPALAISTVLLENVGLYIENFSGTPYTEEENDTLMRFGKVFQQTYTRFLDLQKAEAQTRESQIQLAMERVRARTMAMQRSEELADAATVLFQQVKALGVSQWTCGFNIWEKGDTVFTFYPGSPDGQILPPCKDIPLTEDPVFIIFDESKKNGVEFYVYESKGELQKAHYEYMHKLPGGLGDFLQNLLDAGVEFPVYQIVHIVNFSHGSLLFITYEHFPEMHDIFKRFAKVFEQTYTRFLDLQKAEAQAMEATKRASVDRIRAEIASMRTTNDLERITPLVWNELTTIGVPFLRCGVFIMDEEKMEVQTFLSTPEGSEIAASFQMPYHAHPETSRIVAHWQRKEMYRPHWDAATFIDFTKILSEKGAITTGEKFLVENRPTDLYLHFLPFHQGMLYVGDTTPLSDEHLQLVQALADAFSTAYARYEDFNKLETAKEQIEKTLVDLRQTQAQLVQSEKMASLGELTAGIAHEIQNPLNFMNNFSEVNAELIDEMKDELAADKKEEAIAIANSIKENEQKISHHGKRADAIVKGMLQHSRSSTGQKEPIDINVLVDEYLRLAYHGLRAKEKDFNTTMKTDFDSTIGNINIIPQDIGRVLLNIYNNAFYVVDKKKKQNIVGYDPTVSISTKKIADKVEIRVKDNGDGIPQKVIDKIFQPFFTTKPTGQGTGLGLSLSYDIIKAHGGEIKVDTKEGEFTEFIITLPT